MRQLHLQLYGRTARRDFNERLSTHATATLTPARTTISLELIAPAHEKFIELRLDPDDKPTQFALHGLRILSRDGSEIFRWNGDPAALPALVDLRAWKAKDEVLLEASSNDPFLLLPLPEAQSGSLTLELTVSQALSVPEVSHDNSAARALSVHQQELSDAIRSLQGSLRVALDDLAAEQEGLQDAMVVQHAYARGETDALKNQLSQIAGRLQNLVADVSAVETAFVAQLEQATEGIKSAILAEVRDDWRSLNRQFEHRAAQASKEASERDAVLAARDEELARQMGMLRQFAESHELMKQVRKELGVLNDGDALPKLQQLKAQSHTSREKIAKLENSLCWRLTRIWRR